MTADLGLDWALFWLVVITALLVVHDRLAVRRGGGHLAGSQGELDARAGSHGRGTGRPGAPAARMELVSLNYNDHEGLGEPVPDAVYLKVTVLSGTNPQRSVFDQYIVGTAICHRYRKGHHTWQVRFS
jgi:hypothetical protein